MKFVKIRTISQVKSEPVYHLTINKNHNFFANKLCVHNCSYRGEVKVILVNHSEDRFMINHGDRIAQGVFSPVISKNLVNLIKVDVISTDTERGTGHFGSTGIK